MSNNKKSKLLLLSLVVVLSIAVGVTSAFLIQMTDDVINEFKPTKVTCKVNETFEDNVKSNVFVENTSDIDAYIRATVVVTWQDEDSNVYGKQPVAGTDYTITYNEDGNWVYNEADGFYYYTEKVGYKEPDNVTDVLITECEPAADAAPTGYYLSVEILASAIQADGVSDGEGDPGNVVDEPAVLNAWGVNPTQLGN